MAAGQILAVFTGYRRRVDTEGHTQHRLVDDQTRQRRRKLDRGNGVADLDLGEASHDEQVASFEFVDIVSTDTLERHQL